ncbi:maltotransferase domain-containing protein [Naasia sp. SYSU D00057]|uniref:maltotransferase domain-containing protein n=1 Tax=Naasia sp. SYSU D00057 TaxID=2817380 RepID=UPI0035A88269
MATPGDEVPAGRQAARRTSTRRAVSDGIVTTDPAEVPPEAASASPAPARGRAAAAADWTPVLGRIPILDLSPQQPDDLWPAKAFVGEVVPFAATVFREGHDLLGADVVLTDPRGRTTEHRMTLISKGTDRWRADAIVDRAGFWTYRIKAWGDDFHTWLHNAEVKIPAGVDVELMFTIGQQLFERAAQDKARTAAERRLLTATAKRLASQSLSVKERLESATAPEVAAALERVPVASLVTYSPERRLRVERERAGRGSWYEFFPRSEGAVQREDGSWQSGTFRTAAERLPAIAAMGFDVVYIPPVHPIGTTNRKGPNNTLTAGPHDPGSPYGIGAKEGGHDAIHPELGDENDFKFFVQAVKDQGMELALDIALQASPDHPWVVKHPQFFTQLPDGSIAYAENPPKKYQDIYPLNFDNDPEGIYQEMLRIFRRWIRLGVRIFRVDNPHTKPLAFWERLLHEVNSQYPDVIFLSEAFTRPPMMRGLAKVGFQQSYTYFTWRNSKEELEEYLTELSRETADYLRPNFFVNTHDILTPYLQFGGPPAYRIRAAIAATAVPTWGVYSGYELVENVARPGSEENIDNEKYEFKPRDWARAEETGATLAPFLTELNRIRREHPALGQLRNIDIHWSDDSEILVYSKYIEGRFTSTGASDAVIVVANVDPHSVRETTVHLDPTRFGLDADAAFQVRDLITDQTWTWGQHNYVRLDPFTQPVHILHVVTEVPQQYY